MTVPIAAVGQSSGQDFVWAIEKGALVRRIVVTGRRDVTSGRIEVVKGLGADAQILAVRFDNLKEGAPAKVVAQRASHAASGVDVRRVGAVGIGSPLGVGVVAAGAALVATAEARAMWFTRVSIHNPVFATMVMAALCVLGLFSYSQLRVERLPDITPPIVFVSVAYPGASPEAIETELTRPIELSLNGIAGVKMIRSNSLEGRSETVVEFQLSADMNRAVQDVRDKVAVVQPNFPRDAKQPYVSRFDGDNAQPTVYLSLLGNERSARELSLLADQVVRKRLERATGVARVDVGGMTVRQVRIDLDPQRLRAMQLTPADVSTALQRANADMPVGLLSGSKEDAIVRVEGKVKDAKAFADIVVATRNNAVIRLADLGTLVEREREPDSISRDDGVPSISFQVFKQQDANIVETGEAIKAAAEELRKTLPPGVELRLVYADSDWVARSLAGVKTTLIEGALLTIAIVFLFLHSWRSTIITGLTLPIAVISAFIAVYLFGFTLNFMTMMALSLCIGLLIDDAIVVRENIVRHIHLGRGHRAGVAGRHRRDRPGGDGDDVRDLRRVRPGRVHEGHRRQVLLPVRRHGRGRRPRVAVRELHARPDAVEHLARPARQPAAAECPCSAR